jgi:hypothetical protein
MKPQTYFRPLEDALEEFPGDFNLIRDYLFMAMFHKDDTTRTYAEIMLTKHYGNVIKGVSSENDAIYITVSNGSECRRVFVDDIPEVYRGYPEKIHPFSLD